MRLPGRDGLPRVDDHLDPPEVTRLERIGGVVMEALPAEAPHAIRHSFLDYVIAAHVAPGYSAASDLKTRFEEESDFASDTCILREGKDPESGTRYLEELAFEVVSEQTESKVSLKAPRMVRRGVRRVFAVFVKKGRVAEWSAAKNGWELLDPSASIEDPCLSCPLEVRALVDAASAEDAVAAALVAKGNVVIAQREARRKAEAVLSVLEARGVAVPEPLRSQILSCTNLDVLEGWLRRAAVASSVGEVVGDS